AGEAAMRDTERFHFGFTVPLVPHMGAAGVVAEVGKSKGDLGLVSATAPSSAWWSALEGDDAPKIIARLPFIERGNHPAGLPVFAIARPQPDAIVRDVTMWSVKVSGWTGKAARAASALGELIAIPEGSFDGAALLVSVPQGRTVDDILAGLRGAGVSVRGQALAGRPATRQTIGGDADRPGPTGR